MSSHTLRFATLLVLVAPACASTVNGTIEDVAPSDTFDATRPPDAASDVPSERALDAGVIDATDDPPDTAPPRACEATLIASDFNLAAGGPGHNALLFDELRRTLLLVGSDDGRVLRIDPATGAITRTDPGRYGVTVDAQIALDPALGLLVSVPIAERNRLFLTLDLARADHWETLNIFSIASPSGLTSWVAGYDVTRHALRVVGTPATGATRSFERWSFRAETVTQWSWTQGAGLELPAATSMGTSTWDGSRDALLVFLRAPAGDLAPWSIGDSTSEPLRWTAAPEVQNLGAVWDSSRRTTWVVESGLSGARLTGLRQGSDPTSATVRDAMRLLYATSLNRSALTFDPRARRLYVHSDNIAAGRPSVLSSIDVDRCIP
ncbi:MAG: hypothetical protein U0326_14505 [Polyangiales bacterium]